MRLFIAATTVLSLIGASQALPAASNACQETHQGNITFWQYVYIDETNLYIILKKITVIKGDTCKSIALKYNHSQDDIQQWTKKSNNAFDCDKLKVGDFICVKVNNP